MAKPFDALREKLLRGGVAPRHVGRYLGELADHLKDLRAEEMAAGRSAGDAEAAALARLGSVDELAAAMVQRREFQAWSARAPWAMFSVGPMVMLAMAFYGSLFLMWSGWEIFLPKEHGWLLHVRGFAAFYLVMTRLVYFASPMLVGWAIVGMAARQRVKTFWPVASTALVAVVAGAAQMQIMLVTVPDGLGHVGMTVGLPGSPMMMLGRAVYALMIFVGVLIPYAVWEWWRDRRVRSARVAAGREHRRCGDLLC